MTDFRALCADLYGIFEKYDDESNLAGIYWDMEKECNDILDRARAALAQPEPEGPSIEDVEELCEGHFFNVDGYESHECLQGLINEAIARWGHQPAPPADGEVAECAAELLQRQAPQPVSVHERLPGPEDCDAEHYCWRWNTIGGLWARQPLARRWYEFESHWLPAHALPLPEGGNG